MTLYTNVNRTQQTTILILQSIFFYFPTFNILQHKEVPQTCVCQRFDCQPQLLCFLNPKITHFFSFVFFGLWNEFVCRVIFFVCIFQSLYIFVPFAEGLKSFYFDKGKRKAIDFNSKKPMPM